MLAIDVCESVVMRQEGGVLKTLGIILYVNMSLGTRCHSPHIPCVESFVTMDQEMEKDFMYCCGMCIRREIHAQEVGLLDTVKENTLLVTSYYHIIWKFSGVTG